MSGLSRMNQLNEWQAFINNQLDENWDFNEDNEEEFEVFKRAIPYGISFSLTL